MTDPLLPGYSVTITNLADGGQLGCDTNINVDYSQPSTTETSQVTLTTDATGATVNPQSYDVTGTSGTRTFTVTVPPGTGETGKTVVATISNGPFPKNEDQKVNLSVNCPGHTAGNDTPPTGDGIA